MAAGTRPQVRHVFGEEVFEAVVVESDGVEHSAGGFEPCAAACFLARGACVTVLGITPPSFVKSTKDAISFA